AASCTPPLHDALPISGSSGVIRYRPRGRGAGLISTPSCGRLWDNGAPDAGLHYPMSETDNAPYRSWMCVVCGFIYHEAEGLPERSEEHTSELQSRENR